ncbi:hypothetical protein AKN87_07370 [Thiopseudomonas alkaliphila]|uniref:hypothetical protein n=1 Tax=Thiopseudomonas alkaliphila TaxID=1697053 RepID=UPI00069F97CD|nr:hypothetical protein [Thiopseudomonas alkaliphila]AKX44930.1 hypothetical protein AKN87_07370 [Thiopseudomonas alkaliphila]
MLEAIKEVLMSLGGVIGSIFIIRKGWRLLFPINILPGVHMHFDKLEKDEILATVTNICSETIYIAKCRGRSANSISHIIKTHIRHPFIKPKLYGNVRFGAPIYEMIGPEPVCLAPKQSVNLSYKLSCELPFLAFTNPMLQIEVVLSNGRVFRSKRLKVPSSWHVIKHIHKARENG